MSWFGTDTIVQDSRPNEAVAEGVLLERRSVLRLSAATVASALAFTACASAKKSRTLMGGLPVEATPPGTLEIGQLLSEMSGQAQDVVDLGGSQEEAYLMSIGQLLARLQTPTKDELKAAMRSHRSHARDADSVQIAIVMFDFDPGGGFGHHDHRDYNGVILGTGGELQIKNFDILGKNLVPPEGETFQLRETRDDLILPGRFSSLGSSRDNVHQVTAGPEGARAIDAFTYFERDARSYWMDVDPTPRDAERKIFDAAWS